MFSDGVAKCREKKPCCSAATLCSPSAESLRVSANERAAVGQQQTWDHIYQLPLRERGILHAMAVSYPGTAGPHKLCHNYYSFV